MSTIYPNFLFQKIILTSKGQALIEFAISNLLLISLTTVGSLLIYISFLKYFNHINIYNSILCVAKKRPILVCKYILQKKIQATLLLGKLHKLTLTRKQKTITASIKWTLSKWQFQKKIVFNTLSLAKNLPIIKE